MTHLKETLQLNRFFYRDSKNEYEIQFYFILEDIHRSLEIYLMLYNFRILPIYIIYMNSTQMEVF